MATSHSSDQEIVQKLKHYDIKYIINKYFCLVNIINPRFYTLDSIIGLNW